LDARLEFVATRKGKAVGQLRAKVRMAADGSFYLDSGKGKLFFGQDENKFMFHRLDGEDPWLALLWVALPQLPLVQPNGQQWQDYLPVGIVTTGLRRLLYQFASSFVPQLASARYVAQWQSRETLAGSLAIPGIKRQLSLSATFSPEGALLRVDVGDRALVRM
ncbi:MAG TPA: hypothetical protein DC064_08990, partial [Cyanobacteria bacterium UBA9273]|nr:hypothetical protein [Cyanobacteria bacterium UBA9273]